jgi:hypothetical protein
MMNDNLLSREEEKMGTAIVQAAYAIHIVLGAGLYQRWDKWFRN